MEKYFFTKVFNLLFFSFYHVISGFGQDRRADIQHLYTDGCFMYFNECVGRLNLAAQVDLVYID